MTNRVKTWIRRARPVTKDRLRAEALEALAWAWVETAPDRRKHRNCVIMSKFQASCSALGMRDEAAYGARVELWDEWEIIRVKVIGW
jgi:hypothetical protein